MSRDVVLSQQSGVNNVAFSWPTKNITVTNDSGDENHYGLSCILAIAWANEEINSNCAVFPAILGPKVVIWSIGVVAASWTGQSASPFGNYFRLSLQLELWLIMNFPVNIGRLCCRGKHIWLPTGIWYGNYWTELVFRTKRDSQPCNAYKDIGWLLPWCVF